MQSIGSEGRQEILRLGSIISALGGLGERFGRSIGVLVLLGL